MFESVNNGSGTDRRAERRPLLSGMPWRWPTLPRGEPAGTESKQGVGGRGVETRLAIPRSRSSREELEASAPLAQTHTHRRSCSRWLASPQAQPASHVTLPRTPEQAGRGWGWGWVAAGIVGTPDNRPGEGGHGERLEEAKPWEILHSHLHPSTFSTDTTVSIPTCHSYNSQTNI